MDVLTVEPTRALRGTFRVPGDKSITHRAYLLGAAANGVTEVINPNPGRDCRASLAAAAALGARVQGAGDRVLIEGVGGALAEPADVIQCGNSGTTMRLVAGLVAGGPGLTVLTGDGSLRERPMQRVVTPLAEMGAEFLARAGGRAPLVVRGRPLRAIQYTLPVPSAQLKSAVLLAGIRAQGTTVVVEPVPSRDHTERMLGAFGVPVGAKRLQDCDVVFDQLAALADEHQPPAAGEPRELSIEGGVQLTGTAVNVPGDPSAAAFFAVAALIVPDSEVRIENVCMNPGRRGLFDVLIEMGADLELAGTVEVGGEPRATVVARTSALHGVRVGGRQIPALIDELPILAVAAAFAEGETEVADAAELRVKESDRIALICENLQATGVDVTEHPAGFVIKGGSSPRGATTDGRGDHRIAMAMAVLGLAAQGPVTIRGAREIGTSFPDFASQLPGVDVGGD